MVPLPTRGTYFLALGLVLGVVMVRNLEGLLQLLNGSRIDPVSREDHVARQLPAEVLLPPQKEKVPEAPAPEPVAPAPKPVALQSSPKPSTSEEKVEPGPEPTEEAPKEPAKTEFQIADELPASAAAEFKKMVAEGFQLKKGKKYPGFRARMGSEVIDKLLGKGLIRLAVTDDKPTFFLFKGKLKQPGEAFFAFSADLQGLSERGMQLDPTQRRIFMEAVRSESLGGRKHWSPVILLRSDLDAMVLAAQSRAARRAGVPFKKVRSTTGAFKFLKGLPFNYAIAEITTSDGKRIKVTSAREGAAQKS